MPDAFIYDHVRTPRGRGKPDGALHEVTALNLATQALAAIKERNALEPALVDDVILGCVDPVGEAGGDIARADCDQYAVESQQRAAAAWNDGRFGRSVIRVQDVNGLTILAKDEHMRPDTNMQSLAALKPSFVQIGEIGGFDAVAIQAHPE